MTNLSNVINWEATEKLTTTNYQGASMHARVVLAKDGSAGVGAD